MARSSENEGKVFPRAVYECARCGTRATAAELRALPSPTCANCGYRVFRKVRGSEAKRLRGR